MAALAAKKAPFTRPRFEFATKPRSLECSSSEAHRQPASGASSSIIDEPGLLDMVDFEVTKSKSSPSRRASKSYSRELVRVACGHGDWCARLKSQKSRGREDGSLFALRAARRARPGPRKPDPSPTRNYTYHTLHVLGPTSSRSAVNAMKERNREPTRLRSCNYFESHSFAEEDEDGDE